MWLPQRAGTRLPLRRGEPRFLHTKIDDRVRRIAIDVIAGDMGRRKALDEAEATKGGPTFIVAHTVKGKGVSFMENNVEWHGKAPKPSEAVQAIREILGVSEPAWDEYLRTDTATRRLVDELTALGKK